MAERWKEGNCLPWTMYPNPLLTKDTLGIFFPIHSHMDKDRAMIRKMHKNLYSIGIKRNLPLDKKKNETLNNSTEGAQLISHQPRRQQMITAKYLIQKVPQQHNEVIKRVQKYGNYFTRKRFCLWSSYLIRRYKTSISSQIQCRGRIQNVFEVYERCLQTRATRFKTQILQSKSIQKTYNYKLKVQSSKNKIQNFPWKKAKTEQWKLSRFKNIKSKIDNKHTKPFQNLLQNEQKNSSPQHNQIQS